MEQEAIEIAWLLTDAELKERLKLARTPATENFIAIIESVERTQDNLKLDALKEIFLKLANERNLIVHGAWTMADETPWVVWHKFIEDKYRRFFTFNRYIWRSCGRDGVVKITHV